MRATFLLPLIVLSASLSAQPKPGTRVRLMRESERYEPRRTGSVMSVFGDSAVIRLDARRDPDLPEIAGSFPLTRLEVHAGQRRKELEGAIVGAVVVGAVGYLLGTAIGGACGDAMICIDRGKAQGTLGFGGIAVGALIGGTVGGRRRVDRWRPLIVR